MSCPAEGRGEINGDMREDALRDRGSIGTVHLHNSCYRGGRRRQKREIHGHVAHEQLFQVPSTWTSSSSPTRTPGLHSYSYATRSKLEICNPLPPAAFSCTSGVSDMLPTMVLAEAPGDLGVRPSPPTLLHDEVPSSSVAPDRVQVSRWPQDLHRGPPPQAGYCPVSPRLRGQFACQVSLSAALFFSRSYSSGGELPRKEARSLL